MPTKIEWVRNPDGTQGKTWNPVTGCTKVSEGCRNCYAERMARRLAGHYGYPETPHHFDVTLHPDKLKKPVRRKKPTTYFVCSMSDLFHKDIPLDYVADVFRIMALCRRHTFQVLTKRAERMRETMEALLAWDWVETTWLGASFSVSLPLQNVWLGVSVENQATADERIPLLLQTPAAVRFVSCEPLLSYVELCNLLSHGLHINAFTGETGTREGWPSRKMGQLDWVIVGGESGLGARPMHPDWARAVRDQCQVAGIPFFFKQWGKWWPHDQGRWISEAEQYVGSDWDDNEFYPIGKKAAGRLLDGCTWNEMPEVAQ